MQPFEREGGRVYCDTLEIISLLIVRSASLNRTGRFVKTYLQILLFVTIIVRHYYCASLLLCDNKRLNPAVKST